MTLLTESRAAFVALQAPYVEPTEKPVIGLSIPHLPSGYVFTASEFRQGTMADFIKAESSLKKMRKPEPGRSLEAFVQHGSLDKPKQDIIHIPFLDAD